MDEEGYLNLLQEVLNKGQKKEGRNGNTYSIFGALLKFNTNNGLSFPLITSKKVFFKGIVEELLWFLKGSVNSKELEEKGVNIWKGNSSREYLDSMGFFDYEEGYLGPIYGYQWRSFNGEIDQIKYLLQELSGNSRRALITAWNPVQLKKQALPPCHLLYNFYKNNDNSLNCMMYMRSSDLFLGLPFNIASTTLFAMIIGKVMGMEVKEICISLCDCHIYEEHIEQVKEQLKRKDDLYELPKVKINKHLENPNELSIDEKIKWIEELKYEDFELSNYNSHNSIKAIMK